MCNLNVLYRKNSKNINVVGFIQSVSSYSWLHNNHGEGVFLSVDDSVFKNKEKIDYTKKNLKERIDKSKVIITHQRFSTSGFEVRYNHPFSNKDFTLVHNGVINQFLNGSGSDTSGFFKKFSTEFYKLEKMKLSRQDKIVKIIQELFEDDGGTYSILIFDKRTRQSYYFKNYPSINFYKNDDFLFITTASENRTFLPLLSNKKFVQLDIQSRKIYHIDGRGRVFVVGTIKEPEPEEEPEEEPEVEVKLSKKERKRLQKEKQKELWDSETSEKEWEEFQTEKEEGEYSPEDINREIEAGWGYGK